LQPPNCQIRQSQSFQYSPLGIMIAQQSMAFRNNRRVENRKAE
jgi:hypothetical protein